MTSKQIITVPGYRDQMTQDEVRCANALRSAYVSAPDWVNMEACFPESSLWVIHIDSGDALAHHVLILACEKFPDPRQNLCHAWEQLVAHMEETRDPRWVVEDPIGEGIVSAEDWSSFLVAPARWGLIPAGNVWMREVLSMEDVSLLGPWAMAGLLAQQRADMARWFVGEVLD